MLLLTLTKIQMRCGNAPFYLDRNSNRVWHRAFRLSEIQNRCDNEPFYLDQILNVDDDGRWKFLFQNAFYFGDARRRVAQDRHVQPHVVHVRLLCPQQRFRQLS